VRDDRFREQELCGVHHEHGDGVVRIVLTFTMSAETGWSCSIVQRDDRGGGDHAERDEREHATFTGITVTGDKLRYNCSSY